MTHFLSLSDAELRHWLAERGHAGYRAPQIHRWLAQGRARSFEEMTDLPAALRAQLQDAFCLWAAEVVARRAADDGTEKLLLEFPGGGRIECVLLRDGRRRTICISTQIGCAMGCVFCASGLAGLDRNLSAGEILEQMFQLARLLPAEERLSHVVVMGVGEPLANLGQLLPALEHACSPQGLGISPRRVTISTVGLPAAMDRLAASCPRYHLAVSLHAPNDALRSRLVPANRRWGLQAVLQAADRYCYASGRRLTFEYVLLAGVNDQPEHARQLVQLLKSRPALLNVIPCNPVTGLPYRMPSAAAQRRFRAILEAGGLNVQFRERKGDSIDAACGQLRRGVPGPWTETAHAEPAGDQGPQKLCRSRGVE